MMKARISQLVMDSFGAQLYAKAMDCIHALRQEALKVFNNCLCFYGLCEAKLSRNLVMLSDTRVTLYQSCLTCLLACKCTSIFVICSFQSDEPKTFNDFLRDFRDKLKEKGRKDFWEKLVKGTFVNCVG